MLRNLIVHGLLALNLCSAIGLIKAQYSDFKVGRKQTDYRIGELSDSEFAVYSRLSDKSHLREAVRNILKPRVVGTPGHQQVREYIVQSLRDLNWHVDINSFHDNTPIFGKLHFHNIIAKHNPNAERYLTLACHYDSKYFKEFEFLGATDSAVPCAMMLNMAHVLQKHLEAYKDSKLSLMLIFFDGEEAFEEWGPNDSIYGARHLAKKWEQSGFLDRLDLLVLLDLIGGPDPNFYSFFSKTEGLYSRFLDIEERLSNAEVLERYANSGVTKSYPNRYFQPNALRNSHVEDDHVPFLRLNVPVLHLITMPFPSFWHTKDDSEQVIDYATTENVALILRIFVMEYLHGAKSVAA